MRPFTTDLGQTLWYVGKELSEGPLPALFYFALSAKESLMTDPFNQMVVKLQKSPVRIFSIDLPSHGEGLAATEALKVWAEEIAQGKDPVHSFLNSTAHSIQSLFEQGHLIPEKTAVAGLSRGAFIATEIAARLSWIPTILGFAPLTQMQYAKEFQDMQDNPIVSSLSLSHQIPRLIHKKLRFYISNRDTRVGTKECFDFIFALAEQAYQHRVRAPHIELLIKSPLGHQGHGTSQEIFEEGADWILKEWGLRNAY
jgi:esterase FrsA